MRRLPFVWRRVRLPACFANVWQNNPNLPNIGKRRTGRYDSGMRNKPGKTRSRTIPFLVLLLVCVQALGGCTRSRDEDRHLRKRFSRMFDGYGSWAWGCLHLASREVVRAGTGTLVLEGTCGAEGTVISWDPPVDGRVVTFEEPPDLPAPPELFNEILFVGEEGDFRAVLYHGTDVFLPFWETGGERRRFTWVQFACRPGTLRWP